MSETYLILGGSNSGKSRFAEKSALSLQKNTHGKLYYMATGLAYDLEMQEKINSMGTVVAMITPVASHGVALSRCHDSIW